MEKRTLLTILSLLSGFYLFAQFPGPADSVGTTAIHADSNIFVSWATGCAIARGFQDITRPELGYVTYGDSANALGKADGVNSVVSLGDGGYAILTFSHPIRNGEGMDFAVFENSITDTFLELAFVEVSSDGVNFFRFPAISNTQTETQVGGFGNIDPTQIHNLAGKYRANYGTPFDLEELSGIEGLDINAVTHVKIIDVVGSIHPDYATYDSNNHPINEPYPTPFASGGFDLDAVGVIYESIPTGIQINTQEVHFSAYPNPIQKHQSLKIASNEDIREIAVYSQNGSLQFLGQLSQLDITNLAAGIYFIKVQTPKGIGIQKLIVP